MRFDSLPPFEKYLKNTPLSSLSPLFFIFGKDPFECHEAIQLLLHTLIPSQESRDLALTVFEGGALEESQLGNALYTPSLFAQSKIIWIQHADKLKKSLCENLEKYFEHPSPSQCLILSAPGWQKNTNFYKSADKKGVILDLAEAKPWEKEKRLIEWVNKQVASSRKLMAYPVCQHMVKQVGNDQALLAQELEKLLCYCGDKKEITKQDVDAICSQLHVDTIWLLGESIFRRDSSTALHVGHSLLMDGQPLLPLLRQIRSQFQTEYQVSLLLAQGKQSHEIASEFPYMKGQILERHLHLAQSYGVKSFQQGFLAIETAEMRAKNSSIDDKIVLELLLMQLTSQTL